MSVPGLSEKADRSGVVVKEIIGQFISSTRPAFADVDSPPAAAQTSYPGRKTGNTMGVRRLQVARVRSDPDHWPGQLHGMREALGVDVIKQPELLEKPQHDYVSAVGFKAPKDLNTLAILEETCIVACQRMST